MKVFGLPGDVYRLARLAGRPVPEVALARFELVRRVDGLRAEGLTVAVAIAAVGLSRASYYRWRRQARGGVERHRARDGPTGRWLIAHGVDPSEFNSYGSRRGNHEVMIRGTFGNIRLRNQLAPGTEGGVTTHQPSGEQMSIFAASER